MDYQLLTKKAAEKELKDRGVKNFKYKADEYAYIKLDDNRLIGVCKRLPRIQSTLWHRDDTKRPENNFENFREANLRLNQEKEYENIVKDYYDKKVALNLIEDDGNEVHSVGYLLVNEKMKGAEVVSEQMFEIINEVIGIVAENYEKRLKTYWEKYSDNVFWQGYWADR